MATFASKNSIILLYEAIEQVFCRVGAGAQSCLGGRMEFARCHRTGIAIEFMVSTISSQVIISCS